MTNTIGLWTPSREPSATTSAAVCLDPGTYLMYTMHIPIATALTCQLTLSVANSYLSPNFIPRIYQISFISALEIVPFLNICHHKVFNYEGYQYLFSDYSSVNTFGMLGKFMMM
ncbi:hypothetical protein AB6A40_003233 [Gnathostoma spinigerum]|uniref:Uncharacterized protein n=1 Tax=Gnathostoma spinigerum TaxID=75299 RepID=A0ABD6EEG9_9BILA